MITSQQSNSYPPPLDQLTWQPNGVIVITGGAGFIGSCLFRYCQKIGQACLIVDEITDKPQKLHNIQQQKPYPIVLAPRKFVNLANNLTTADLPAHIFPKANIPNSLAIRAIIHLGAISDTTARDKKLIDEKNTRYSETIWQIATRLSLPLIYASSAATYGAGEMGFSAINDLNHCQQLKPLNFYGESKHMFDCFMLEKKQLAKQNLTQTPNFFAGLKFFNVFGPNEYHKNKQSSVIPHFTKQALTQKAIYLFQSIDPKIPNGEQQRDFIWVMDCVWVILKLLQWSENNNALTKLQHSGLYNVGAGQSHSFLTIAKAILTALPTPYHTCPIEFIPTPPNIAKHYQNYTLADIMPLKQLLGFQPTNVLTAVQYYVKQYLTKPPKSNSSNPDLLYTLSYF